MALAMSGAVEKKSSFLNGGNLFSIIDLMKVIGRMEQEHFQELRWQSSSPFTLLNPSLPPFSMAWYEEPAVEITLGFAEAIAERVQVNLATSTINAVGSPSRFQYDRTEGRR